jgi:threonyl-tRNA synthetase
MTDITIAIENGNEAAMPVNTTVQDAISELMSNKQRKLTVAVVSNGKVLDLCSEISENATLIPIQIGSDESLAILRHSTAHVMAEAVRELYGNEVKVAIGPAIDDGFYYDFDRDQPFTPEDFEKIEAKMTEIIRSAQPFSRSELSSADAIKRFEMEGEPYKVELIQDLGADTVSLYEQGAFTDLCRGPHLPNTSFINAFKLLRVAGAYWRGDENKKMLQRIYGTAFFDKKALTKHLFALEG